MSHTTSIFANMSWCKCAYMSWSPYATRALHFHVFFCRRVLAAGKHSCVQLISRYLHPNVWKHVRGSEIKNSPNNIVLFKWFTNYRKNNKLVFWWRLYIQLYSARWTTMQVSPFASKFSHLSVCSLILPHQVVWRKHKPFWSYELTLYM